MWKVWQQQKLLHKKTDNYTRYAGGSGRAGGIAVQGWNGICRIRTDMFTYCCIINVPDNKKKSSFMDKIFKNGQSPFRFHYGFNGICLRPVDSIRPKMIFIF